VSAMGIFGSPQEQVELDDLKSRVAKLEQAVAQLQAQLAAGAGGVPYGAPMPTATGAGTTVGAPDWMAEVQGLTASGNKIQAIKVYREHTGVGLKEAKDAVEAL
jgi:large subunit ribosomal protein L7/L12